MFTESDLLQLLVARYGLFMTTKEVRATLKFNTATAFSMARRRGHVHLIPCEMRGRRTHVYPTSDVAREAVAHLKGGQE